MFRLIIFISLVLSANNLFSQADHVNKNPLLNNVLQLNITGNGYQDNLFVAYINGATFGYDGQFDVVKLFGIYQAPQFFSIIPGNINLSINSLPDINYYNTVQLGLYVGKDTLYTITATGTSSFTNFLSIVLEDTKNNINTELMQQQIYSFLAYTSDSVSRFKLHFSNPTIIDENFKNEIEIFNTNKKIYVLSIGDEYIKKVEIFGIKGEKVLDKTYYNLKKIEISDFFHPGFYLIKVLTNSNKTYTKKIQVL